MTPETKVIEVAGGGGKIIEEFVIENVRNPCDRLKRLIGYLNRFYEAGE